LVLSDGPEFGDNGSQYPDGMIGITARNALPNQLVSLLLRCFPAK